MLFLKEPAPGRIESLRSARSFAPFSYLQVGATESSPPAGWRVHHRRALVGRGPEDHARAVRALLSWRLLEIEGLTVYPSAPTVVPQAEVAILSRHLGIWSVDFCRVVHRFDQVFDADREHLTTGFTYGTLPGHAMRGEERFSIEHHPGTGEVWYDIFSFSRPATWLVRLAAPFARATQRRFARASMENAARLAREENAAG